MKRTYCHNAIKSPVSITDTGLLSVWLIYILNSGEFDNYLKLTFTAGPFC